MIPVARTEHFLNDLSEEDVTTLMDVVSRLDPLATEDGIPRYSGDEIDLIQRFAAFAADNDEDDIEEEDDEDGDIPGTGESDVL